MLSPMLVQYVVGLCCLRRDPGAVDVTLGDMVVDSATGKKRDVDVTVTLAESDGTTRAFKAYEVKREKTPLDVVTVEQLCIKLRDMDSVTHRAIVSASGFTGPAQAKAAHHGVDLFVIVPWTRPVEEQFPHCGLHGSPEEAIRFGRLLLCWRDWTFGLDAPRDSRSFTEQIQATDAVLTADGSKHSTFSSAAVLEHEILLRSTELLPNDERPVTERNKILSQPINALGPGWNGSAWPYTHAVDFVEDGVYMRVGDSLTRIDRATIHGTLQWKITKDRHAYYLLEGVPDGKPFASALIALGEREGQMYGFVLAPGSAAAGIHIIQLEEKQLNAIRQLRIDRSS
jgi:hypothetical protein